ncbi:VOC family protein [Paenibacillus aurantiacus]|uniref:VOC family protein n=1 Tax=Paenibacillus aurantiacus TaxID=1936118 RepID=A0ABV5KH81_9BACL
MNTSQTLRGFATVSYWAEDMEAAKAWYTSLLGIAPYFERSGPDGSLAYVEFRLGDYQHEMGLINRRFAPADASHVPGGAILYWHVDDIEATLHRLKSMGAAEYEPLVHRGVGFITASVTDPFGNVLGIMYNAHYLEMLDARMQEQSAIAE